MYILLIIGILIFLSGLWLIFRGRRYYRASMASVTWPQVQGQILDAGVDQVSTRKETMYMPRVVYTYTIAEMTYKSNRLIIGDSWWTSRWLSSAESAQEQVSAYKTGETIAVAYNPGKPTEATLLPGESRGARDTFSAGGGLSLIGIVMIVLAIALMMT